MQSLVEIVQYAPAVGASENVVFVFFDHARKHGAVDERGGG